VDVGVAVGGSGVKVGVSVIVKVGVMVGVRVKVKVGVIVGDRVALGGTGVGVAVPPIGVSVGDRVALGGTGVGVDVGIGVGVAVAWASTLYATDGIPPSPSRIAALPRSLPMLLGKPVRWSITTRGREDSSIAAPLASWVPSRMVSNATRESSSARCQKVPEPRLIQRPPMCLAAHGAASREIHAFPFPRWRGKRAATGQRDSRSI
jgi:hypothetical protein